MASRPLLLEGIMAFDLAKLDIATPSDEGRDMKVRYPNGNPVLDDKGEPLTVKLLGRFSERARAKEREQTLKRLEQQKNGITRGPEDFEREAQDYLAACTVGWSFDTLDGAPFAYSPENALKLWRDRRFGHVRLQADAFIGGDANFMSG